ncbi:unnamed protein product [Musa acuminata subsp. malaccensis]|uniref:(wild Malaysian banana) hypothetical protein n=1 Tax=Musa acuminata subsp. malaccensis TaxID=214687 RepID=A0A8D7FKK9_MUSAM|nr:unnamed protein product [Musa acuminata subsp. malaccensis]
MYFLTLKTIQTQLRRRTRRRKTNGRDESAICVQILYREMPNNRYVLYPSSTESVVIAVDTSDRTGRRHGCSNKHGDRRRPVARLEHLRRTVASGYRLRHLQVIKGALFEQPYAETPRCTALVTAE